MKHLKKFEQYESVPNTLQLAEDMDLRLEGNEKWQNFVTTEFDKYHVDNWFDYLHSGGDLEKAIEYGEELIIKDAYA